MRIVFRWCVRRFRRWMFEQQQMRSIVRSTSSQVPGRLRFGEEEHNVCGICTERLHTFSHIRQYDVCKHVYCKKCIEDYAFHCYETNKRPQCPTCRAFL
jgi:hypothetical protein